MEHTLVLFAPHVGLPFEVAIAGGLIRECGFVLPSSEGAAPNHATPSNPTGRTVPTTHPAAHPALEPATQRILTALTSQWDEYLAGNLEAFDLPLAAAPTAFACDVRAALCEVPGGETVTYGELAALAGHPGAARAVGTVCRTNPFQLIVPCHRVLPASGGIGAYMGRTGGPGAKIKEHLLAYEGVDVEAIAAGSRR